MIIATAGHVDHGKTALIRALTGQETDRSAEEQRRGMSIELGYAHIDWPDGCTADLVDVPGHEKFMRTLLSGVSCVEGVMLVVAADDGLMPQTHEHIQLLNLLGIRQLMLVISKCAKVARTRQLEVQAQVLVALRLADLPEPPSFFVDSLQPSGIEELGMALHDWVTRQPPRPRDGLARMAIDRHFSQPGAGHVVTGTLLAGIIQPGDSLLLSSSGQPLRVRSLQVHGKQVTQVQAGQRCALDLVGAVQAQELQRGAQLLAASAWAPIRRFDCQLQLTSPLPRHGQVQLHMVGAVVNARWRAVGGKDSGYAQWLLEQPLCCRRGDRLVVRDPASRRLLGSGMVLDPFAADQRRHRPERLAALAALSQENPERALAGLANSLTDGVDLQRFARTLHLSNDQLEGLVHELSLQQAMYQQGHWLAPQQRLLTTCDLLVEATQSYHLQHPDQRGPNLSQLARITTMPIRSKLLQQALRTCLDNGELKQSGPCLQRPEHQPLLPEPLQQTLKQLRPLFEACAPRPPIIGELMQNLNLPREQLLEQLDQLGHKGELVRVGRNRYLLPASLEQLLQVAAESAARDQHGRIDTALFRDLSGIGRNHSVALLEYLDAVGLTRLRPDGRRLAWRGKP
ncbi:MAG: selenocysteine-specific translation elongation factor [Pseudomonas sp.]